MWQHRGVPGTSQNSPCVTPARAGVTGGGCGCGCGCPLGGTGGRGVGAFHCRLPTIPPARELPACPVRDAPHAIGKGQTHHGQQRCDEPEPADNFGDAPAGGRSHGQRLRRPHGSPRARHERPVGNDAAGRGSPPRRQRHSGDAGAQHGERGRLPGAGGPHRVLGERGEPGDERPLHRRRVEAGADHPGRAAARARRDVLRPAQPRRRRVHGAGRRVRRARCVDRAEAGGRGAIVEPPHGVWRTRRGAASSRNGPKNG